MLAFAVMIAWPAAMIQPTGIPAAVTTPGRSAADSAKIAMLIFQARSTQDAAAKSMDAMTITLRQQLDASRGALSHARQTLSALRAQSDVAKAARTRVAQLDAKVTQLTLDYSARLAEQDAGYRRERMQLLAAAERLLETPDGRRALDLYNSGDSGHWAEAKIVLDKVRHARRASDTRAAARLYEEKMGQGQEPASSVIAMFEEIVADGFVEASDALSLSNLYSSEHRLIEAAKAAESAFSLAQDDQTRLQAAMSAIMMLSVTSRLRDADRYVIAGDQIIGRMQRVDPDKIETIVMTSLYVGARAFHASADGRKRETLTLHSKIVDLWAKMMNLYPSITFTRDSWANALVMRGNDRGEAKDWTGALRDYHAALPILTPTADGTSTSDAMARINTGRIDIRQKRPREALSVVLPVIERLRRRANGTGLVSDYDQLIDALVVISDAHNNLHDMSAAEASLTDALTVALRMRSHAPDSAVANYQVMMQRQRLAAIGAKGHSWKAVVAEIDAMERAGMLPGEDIRSLAPLRDRAMAEDMR